MTILKQRCRQSLGIFVICFLLNDLSLAEDGTREPYTIFATKTNNEPEGRALFNPRVDYNNQWMTVGHSDPLKNEPTFDYSPPTLERVRYWSTDESNNNNNEQTNNANGNLNEKSEILMLGVPTKHTLYPHKAHQTNQLVQTEAKPSNRRSSIYYPPEPSRVLTPPPMQPNPVPFDQVPFTSEHHMPPTYWNNELPQSVPDAYSEESASYLTVIKPKTSQSPYTTTLYNKDVRNSIYHLAANVNSLEISDKKNAWVQSLLQKEVTYQPQSTTPQVVVAYSPHIFEPTPLKFHKATDLFHSATESTFTTSTTSVTTTTPSPITLLKAAIIPTRPPLYLIIQGHSKVKTYGAETSNSKKPNHEPKMVPVTNEDPVVKHVVSQDLSGNEIQVKHLHKLHTLVAKVKSTTPSPFKKVSISPMESLLSLLDKSFAGFTLSGNKEIKPTAATEIKKSNGLSTVLNESKKSTGGSTISTITGPTTLRPLNETESSLFR